MIPIIEKDLVHLESLLDALQGQSVSIHEAVMVFSGLRPSSRHFASSVAARSGVAVTAVFRTFVHSAGSNRNRGSRIASGDYVSVFDPDDIPHRLRNARIRDAIERFSASQRLVIMHSFERIPRDALAPKSRPGLDSELGLVKTNFDLDPDRLERLTK